MPFATWWQGDPLPDLSPLPTFSARTVPPEAPFIAQLTHLSPEGISARFQAAHRLYIAFMGEVPAAYGWVATREAGIAELQFSFSIPAKNRYLWDFQTLPAWRGRGIYPHLLQAIIREERSADRFWIGYVPGNEASARGISKAGFRLAGDFVVAGGRIMGLTLFDASEYALAIADFLRLPIVPEG